MNGNKNSQVKVFQVEGFDAVIKLNDFLIEKKISRDQIIDLNIWHKYLDMANGSCSVLTLTYCENAEKE